MGQNWSDVGVQTTVKEVTPDEYRSAQSSNQLDVLMWLKGQPVAIQLGNTDYWMPPFDGYFDLRTGMLWAEYIERNGAIGRGAAGLGRTRWATRSTRSSRRNPGSDEQAAAGRLACRDYRRPDAVPRYRASPRRRSTTATR